MSTIGPDTFTRADEATLTGNYTTGISVAALQLFTNAVYATSLGTSCLAYWNADTFTDNQWAQVDVTIWDTADTILHGAPALRCSTTDRSYYVGQSGGLSTLSGSNLERRVAGVKTVVASEATTSLTAPFTVYLEFNGTAYNLKINGTSTLSGTDAGGLTTGRIGIFGYAQDSNLHLSMDNFTGGDLATAISEPSLPRSAYQAVKRGAFF